MKPIVCLVLGALFLQPVPALADDKRPMVPEDYYRFTFINSPQISPDSSEVVYVAGTVSEDRRSRATSLWLVATTDDAESVRLTAGDADAAPQWSPDGTWIAFLRPTETKDTAQSGQPKKETQVFRIRRAGGEAQALTAIEGGVSSFLWSPDGQHLLLTRRTAEDDADSEEDSDAQDDGTGDDQPEPDVEVFRNTLYKRNGVGYLDDKRSHFWLFDIQTRQQRRLTSGADWNDGNPSFAPNGKSLVFDADHSGDEYDGGPNDDLWIIGLDEPAEGSSPADLPVVQQLTVHPHSDSSPRWSPDGTSIAYLHTDGPYEQTEILLRDAAGQQPPKSLTDDFDRQPANLRWLPDSQSLLFTAADQGARRLFRLDLVSGKIRSLLSGDVSVADLDVATGGDLLAFTLQDEARLPEVWVCEPDGSQARPLTHANAKVLAELDLRSLEPMTFDNDTGGSVQGFVLKPVGWKPGETYPLVLEVKGGPGGMWGHSWMQEFHMLAGKGWGVAFVNYRGSTGYGLAHQQAIRLDYGGVDYRDNIHFLDTVLERFDWIDPQQLFLTGGSHGGFLTNWILTRTNRFRAAVTQRSVASWLSEAGTQQFTPRQMREEFGGSPWENFDLYWDRSPIKYADRIKTPTLIIHSDQDHICPIGQAQELFYALKAHGVETELVVFKGENHSLSRSGTPVNLVERLRRIIRWFDDHS